MADFKIKMSTITKKIVLLTALSATIIIILFSSYIVYHNYNELINNTKKEQMLITEGQSILLSQYIYEKDEENIYLTLSGIIANPKIVGAAIFNEAGNIIFSIGESEPNPDLFTYSHAITYFEQGSVVSLGQLETYASNALILKSVSDRIWTFAVLIILVVFAIVVTVAFTVHHIIDLPVRILAEAFSSETTEEEEPLAWHQNDEMGLLILQFNKLNSRLRNALSGLRTELRENEILEAERLKSLADAAFEGIIIHRDGLILDANEATSLLVGVPRADIVGSNVEDCIGAASWRCKRALHDTGDTFQQKTICPISAPECTVEISSKGINYQGKAACVVAIRDVTDRINSQKKIEFLARYDQLTKISNRFNFKQYLEASLSCDNSADKIGAVLYLDLDGFKSVNDFNGHAVGDELLRQVALRLQSTVRETDAIARLGGDEFAVAMSGSTNAAYAQKLAKKLIMKLSETYTIEDAEVKIGVSIGISLCEEKNQSAENILKQADLALYEVKRSGKGECQLYHHGMESRHIRTREVENRLRMALQKKQIEVYFQPKANAITREIEGFEALARWNDPVLGTVCPDEFISVAEQTGLICQLGEQVLEKACEAAASWPPQYGLSVNLSAAEFTKIDLVDSIKQTLKKTDFDPKRLEFEITETALMHDEKVALLSIRQLKGLGSTIAIDDFGTGYSSLSFLQRYPFDRIKIDKSFVLGMENTEEAALIVRSIINLSHSLNIGVIAEGVETESALRALRTECCREVQGNLIGHPVPASEVETYFLNERNAIKPTHAIST